MHYVPLSYSAADVVTKIEWLKKNDHLAQKIAQNARNFGISYLRLEDQYCYVATALETFAELEKEGDATQGWDPKPCRYQGGARRLIDEKEEVGSDEMSDLFGSD